MTILIFLLVLVMIILVHEVGHFIVAKLSGMRVDEFGIGFPPRVFARRIGETEYSINMFPFGGFVKIYGEDGAKAPNGSSDEPLGARPRNAFTDKNRFLQALVLVAGVTMNIVLAWVIFSGTFALGVPRALSLEEIPKASDAILVVSRVLPSSPAERAGLHEGDTIISVQSDHGSFVGADPNVFTNFVSAGAKGDVLAVSLRHHRGEEETVFVSPATEIVPGEPMRLALGISVGAVGTVPTPWYVAPLEGTKMTYHVTKETARELAHLFLRFFTFSADLSQVSGPVGLVGVVGNASGEGFLALLSLTALISVNLAIINLLPIPALDGGRLLFVIIESIIRRPLKPALSRAVNAAGFALLLLLMLVVTAHDIFKIIG